MSRKGAVENIDFFHAHDLHIPTRTIYMGQETNHEMAERFIKNITHLESLNADPITIIMNNIGGDELDGLAIYDAIKLSKCHITMKVFGNAMSMGSIILQAADKRLMAPNAKVMIHYGTVMVASMDLHAKTQYKWIEESKRFDSFMENLFLLKIKVKDDTISLSKVRKLLEFDTILSAEEAIELNLADEILK